MRENKDLKEFKEDELKKLQKNDILERFLETSRANLPEMTYQRKVNEQDISTAETETQ